MNSPSFFCWVLAVSLIAVTGGAGRGLAAGPGFTFQGQLLDADLPRNGTCDLLFKLFDAPTGGTQIGGAEQFIPSVSVQNGLFTVKLNGDGQFGPTAFDGGDRWLEIAVRCPAGAGSFSAPFNPRQEITAVPYALHVSSGPTGLVDNGDGTVTDHSTGLMWEKKTGVVTSTINCSTTPCPDPHDVNNGYEWCDDTSPDDFVCDNPGLYDGHPPDGSAFSDFLARTNGRLCETSSCTGLAGYTDWRIPTLDELSTILDAPCPPGDTPCIDPVFGPTQDGTYWSSSTIGTIQAYVFVVTFNGGIGFEFEKGGLLYVRAVRGGM